MRLLQLFERLMPYDGFSFPLPIHPTLLRQISTFRHLNNFFWGTELKDWHTVLSPHLTLFSHTCWTTTMSIYNYNIVAMIFYVPVEIYMNGNLFYYQRKCNCVELVNNSYSVEIFITCGVWRWVRNEIFLHQSDRNTPLQIER